MACFIENFLKKMAVNDINSIREYFSQLKKARKVLNWEEFADIVKYDRTYVSRVINGHEPLTQEFIDRVNKADFNATGNVSRETSILKDKIIASHEKTIGSYEREIERLQKQNDISLTALTENVKAIKEILEGLENKLGLSPGGDTLRDYSKKPNRKGNDPV